jgi:outer membrane protein assembly factor BamB
MHRDATTMTPRLFDFHSNDVSDDDVHLLTPWKRITIDPDYAGAWIVAGDIDGDGEVEIVSARNCDIKDVHHTASVVAHKLDGSVLWRWGDPAAGQNELQFDVACQIYDWNGDGRNEVVVITDQAVIELDGTTGKERYRLAIPCQASDSLVFANFNGGERATDILVKTRYSQVWAYSREGKLLWTYEVPDGYGTAHQPRPMDINGDGLDEIMVGYAMLSADGQRLWGLEGNNLPLLAGHLDCIRLFHRGQTPAETRFVFTLCSAGCIAMVDGEGKLVWSLTGQHFESIDIGKVCPDVAGRQIVVDIDHCEPGDSPLWLLDETGDLLGRIVTDYSRHHRLVDWHGCGVDSIVLGVAAAMFDGNGRKVARFDIAPTQTGMCERADMTGDGSMDLIFSSNPVTDVCIFRNECGKPAAGVALGTGDNVTLY